MSAEASLFDQPQDEHPQLTIPSELERHIFEIGALSQPASIPVLMLVAWRVKEWVEPLLYRTLVIRPFLGPYPTITPEIILRKVDSKHADFFRGSVRNVFIDPEIAASIEPFLSICTRLENLWVQVSVDIFEQNSGLAFALTRLYTASDALQPQLFSTHKIFASLTHLDLTLAPELELAELELWSSSLALLPQLTHLSFDEEDFIIICPSLLRNCKLLCVLVDVGGRWRTKIDSPLYDELSRDPRFVVMQHDWNGSPGWLATLESGEDHWGRAERWVAKRRSGEVEARIYEMQDQF